MRLARLLTLVLTFMIGVLTLAGCGGGGGGNAAPGGGDTTAPTVSLTAPASGATVTGASTITATAADNVGVSRVEFYVNGALQGTTVSAPYSFSWDTTTLNHGSQTLSAKAFDAAGNVGLSPNVIVNVPITVSINTVMTGPTTAVGTITLAGFSTANPYGINMKIAPAGSTITSLARLGQGVLDLAPSLDSDNVTILVGNSISSGPILQVEFSNVPTGTALGDFGITLLAVYELGSQIQ